MVKRVGAKGSTCFGCIARVGRYPVHSRTIGLVEDTSAWSTKYTPRWKDWQRFVVVPGARHGPATPTAGCRGASHAGQWRLAGRTAQKVEKAEVRRVLAQHSPWPSIRSGSGGQEDRINLKRRTRLLSTCRHGHLLVSLCSLRRRQRPRRFANLLMARSHRNTLAHAVKRTSQRTNAVGMRPCPGNWNPTTTRNLTTPTSLRTRKFIPETWLRFCGSPGLRDSRPVVN